MERLSKIYWDWRDKTLCTSKQVLYNEGKRASSHPDRWTRVSYQGRISNYDGWQEIAGVIFLNIEGISHKVYSIDEYNKKLEVIK